MNCYNINPLDFNHPTTGDHIDTAVKARVTTKVTSAEGTTTAVSFYEFLNADGNVIRFGRGNEYPNADGWGGDYALLDARVLELWGAVIVNE